MFSHFSAGTWSPSDRKPYTRASFSAEDLALSWDSAASGGAPDTTRRSAGAREPTLKHLSGGRSWPAARLESSARTWAYRPLVIFFPGGRGTWECRGLRKSTGRAPESRSATLRRPTGARLPPPVPRPPESLRVPPRPGRSPLGHSLDLKKV